MAQIIGEGLRAGDRLTRRKSSLKRHLLAGVATFALLAAGSAYTMRAYSADARLAERPSAQALLLGRLLRRS
jgi:hypothetical protein